MWWRRPKQLPTNVFQMSKLVQLVVDEHYPAKIILHPNDFWQVMNRLNSDSCELAQKRGYIPIRGTKIVCGKRLSHTVDLSKSPREWGPAHEWTS